MERYIALLRGINVGGKNKVSMPELKNILEQGGFHNVVTYINSGNIMFSCDLDTEEAIKKTFENLIYEGLNLRIPVAIVKAEALLAAVEHAPSWWGKGAESKHNAIFVIAPVLVSQIFEEVGETKPEYEQLDFYENVIYWSAPTVTFSRTRLSKVVSSAIYTSITIRNHNTVLKLAELVR